MSGQDALEEWRYGRVEEELHFQGQLPNVAAERIGDTSDSVNANDQVGTATRLTGRNHHGRQRRVADNAIVPVIIHRGQDIMEYPAQRSLHAELLRG